MVVKCLCTGHKDFLMHHNFCPKVTAENPSKRAMNRVSGVMKFITMFCGNLECNDSGFFFSNNGSGFFFLVVVGIRTPNLAYFIHCPYN